MRPSTAGKPTPAPRQLPCRRHGNTHLAARFTEALVRGVQGPPESHFGPDRAAVVLKHFAGQGATVGGRNRAATELGARELHEIHLEAALAGIRAGAAGVMAAYNEFDGIPCAADRELLTGILRERWGFTGLVMADGLALDRLVRLAGDPVTAGALALEAGTDLSLWDGCFPRLEQAVRRGLKATAPDGTEVAHFRGSDLVGGDLSALPEAVALAAGADVAVVVLGGSSARASGTRFDANGAAVAVSGNPAGMTCGEGVDLAELGLPEGQSALLDAIAGTGTSVVVVLVQGRPHTLPDLADRAGAVLSAWYPGPWGGRAVADVLFGAAEPVGRLPVSVPRSAAQLPVYYNAKDHGYRGYVDQPATPRHAFGHGLAYTSVEYGAPRLSRAYVAVAEFDADAARGAAEPLLCTVEVHNTGDRSVGETVQLYVRRVLGGTSWPRVRELRGFARIELVPGERTEVSFPVGARTLASVTRGWERAVRPGEFAIAMGPSSDRTRGARLVVTAPTNGICR